MNSNPKRWERYPPLYFLWAFWSIKRPNRIIMPKLHLYTISVILSHLTWKSVKKCQFSDLDFEVSEVKWTSDFKFVFLPLYIVKRSKHNTIDSKWYLSTLGKCMFIRNFRPSAAPPPPVLINIASKGYIMNDF